jgi:AI-2 transport protein TqsA
MEKMETEEEPEAALQNSTRLLTITLSTGLVIAGFWLLSIGGALLIPLVLAVFVWYLIEGINSFWKRVRIAGKPIPRLAPALMSALVIFLVCAATLSLVSSNVAQMAEAAPKYQEKLGALYEQVTSSFGIDEKEERAFLDSLMERIDLAEITTKLGAALGTLMSNTILIAMYVIFLLLERQFFDAKLCAIVKGEGKRDSVRKAIGRIDQQVRVYLSVKIFVSLITAAGAYIVMRLVGLDFAVFWALLIFVLNFIPYIGSTIASLMPTVLALAQFGTLTQALIVFAGIQAVQMGVGYVIEPTMMGKSLNISPLSVMLVLAFWGMLWGITGMFIAVPITVIIMIICANFDASRWITVLLSKDGTTRE